MRASSTNRSSRPDPRGCTGAGATAAGPLAGDRPVVTGVKAAARYHGALPVEPVGPRGTGQLVVFSLLALTSLMLIVGGVTGLAVLRRSPDRGNR